MTFFLASTDMTELLLATVRVHCVFTALTALPLHALQFHSDHAFTEVTLRSYYNHDVLQMFVA